MTTLAIDLTHDFLFTALETATSGHIHKDVLAKLEAPLIAHMLEKCEHNQVHAADMLGINRNTLRKKMKEYGIPSQPRYNWKPALEVPMMGVVIP